MADAAVSLSPTTARQARDQSSRRRLRTFLLLGTAALVTASYLAGALTPAAGTNFVVVFSSLLLQAVPLVMMGAFVAAVIGTFVPASAFERIGRLPEPLQIPSRDWLVSLSRYVSAVPCRWLVAWWTAG